MTAHVRRRLIATTSRIRQSTPTGVVRCRISSAMSPGYGRRHFPRISCLAPRYTALSSTTFVSCLPVVHRQHSIACSTSIKPNGLRATQAAYGSGRMNRSTRSTHWQAGSCQVPAERRRPARRDNPRGRRTVAWSDHTGPARCVGHRRSHRRVGGGTDRHRLEDRLIALVAGPD
jgi:hypothetical protein